MRAVRMHVSVRMFERNQGLRTTDCLRPTPCQLYCSSMSRTRRHTENHTWLFSTLALRNTRSTGSKVARNRSPHSSSNFTLVMVVVKSAPSKTFSISIVVCDAFESSFLACSQWFRIFRIVDLSAETSLWSLRLISAAQKPASLRSKSLPPKRESPAVAFTSKMPAYCRVSGFGFRVSSSGFRVQGFGFGSWHLFSTSRARTHTHTHTPTHPHTHPHTHTHGSTLPPPECFRKHAEARYHRISASGSTLKHCAGTRVRPEALSIPLPPPECFRNYFAAGRALPEALASTLPAPERVRKHSAGTNMLPEALCSRHSASALRV